MKLGLLLFLTVFYSGMNLCKAQDCESVLKVKGKDGIACMGLVDRPPVTGALTDGLYSFLLAKLATSSDTSYKLNLVANATVPATKTNEKSIRFQFADGSIIVKPEQALEGISFPGDKIMYTAELALSLAEIIKLKNGLRVSIALAGSEMLIAEPLSTSIKQAADCLISTW